VSSYSLRELLNFIDFRLSTFDLYMNQIHLQIVTPEKTFPARTVSSVSLFTELGQITVLPGHAALVSSLVPGEAEVQEGGQASTFHVAGGFVKVTQKNGMTDIVVLADAAEHADEIDEVRARAAEQRAREQLASAEKLSEEEYALATAALERSLTRIRIARKRASHKKTFSDDERK